MKNYVIDPTVLKILMGIADDDEANEVYLQHLKVVEKLVGTSIENSQQNGANLSKEDLTQLVQDNVNALNQAIYDKYYLSLEDEAKKILDDYLSEYAKLHTEIANYIENLYTALKNNTPVEEVTVPIVPAITVESSLPASDPSAPVVAPTTPVPTTTVAPPETQINLGGLKGSAAPVPESALPVGDTTANPV